MLTERNRLYESSRMKLSMLSISQNVLQYNEQSRIFCELQQLAKNSLERVRKKNEDAMRLKFKTAPLHGYK